jgi:hypothetical protein
MKSLAELAGGPALYMKCQGQFIHLFGPTVRYSGEDDSLLAFRLKIPAKTRQTVYKRI